jgi:polyisoprenoid-binding protein YceI
MSATTPETLAGTWSYDPIHSTASFSVKHMVVSSFTTSFKEVSATLAVEDAEIKITGTVQVESIDIDLEPFKAHLLSGEFFDAENTPTVEFVSTSVQRDGDNVTVEGDLTVRGTTKPVTATGTIVGPVADMTGKDRVGVELQTILDRTEYGLNWNQPLPKGGVALANDVALNVHLEFVRAED